MNRSEATDEQWEGLAEVVPLRGYHTWPSWANHRALPEGEPETAARQRKLVVLRVQFFADAREVAEHLIAGTPVLLDLTSADADVARRVLDFSSGVVFGLGSGMHRVDTNVFLLAPEGTQVAAAYPDRRKNEPVKRFG
ncbi:cell division protein SepF [Streptomyces orinoci]|uniref:Cell division protein SepF n=1 Tax=Streptomyces orinoci TaxID=67339 RepID=A0ABV3K4N4_STRON|nr:cell division protein SepF [Streptomyces orinoci]